MVHSAVTIMPVGSSKCFDNPRRVSHTVGQLGDNNRGGRLSYVAATSFDSRLETNAPNGLLALTFPACAFICAIDAPDGHLAAGQSLVQRQFTPNGGYVATGLVGACLVPRGRLFPCVPPCGHARFDVCVRACGGGRCGCLMQRLPAASASFLRTPRPRLSLQAFERAPRSLASFASRISATTNASRSFRAKPFRQRAVLRLFSSAGAGGPEPPQAGVPFGSRNACRDAWRDPRAIGLLPEPPALRQQGFGHHKRLALGLDQRRFSSVRG